MSRKCDRARSLCKGLLDQASHRERKLHEGGIIAFGRESCAWGAVASLDEVVMFGRGVAFSGGREIGQSTDHLCLPHSLGGP